MTRSLGKCCNNSGDAAVPMIIFRTRVEPPTGCLQVSDTASHPAAIGHAHSAIVLPIALGAHCRIRVDHSNRAQSAELAGNITRSTGREGSSPSDQLDHLTP